MLKKIFGLMAIVGAGPAALPPAGAATTFNFKAKQQIYKVPAGAKGLHVVLVGASGAAAAVGSTAYGNPGSGARLVADIPLPTGTTVLYVEVGGVGASANPPSVPYTGTGGWNGGGDGPFGGGGASDIRTVSCGTASDCAVGGGMTSLQSRLAVAGGGGAGGGTQAGGGNANGGSAGKANGAGNSGDSIISGIGATPTSGGPPIDQPTLTSYCQDTGAHDGEQGGTGDLGVGGNGAYLFIIGTSLAGGGGGGLYGGGGGSQCFDSSGDATTVAGSGGAGSSGTMHGQHIKITADSKDPSMVAITEPVPTATGKPTISGTPALGHTLTEAHGKWSSTRPISGYKYQWERCNSSGGSCKPITGATSQTYKLKSADKGHTLRVQEWAANFYGTAHSPATSKHTHIVS